MLDQAQFEKLITRFPEIGGVQDDLLRRLQSEAFYATIPAGKEIFFPNDDVTAIALLLSGAVRVYKMGDTGREITLYRFFAGESCIMTANAILNSQPFSAIATVEEDAEAIMIPATSFKHWVSKYEIWREFLYNLLSRRLAIVLEIVDEITFGRLDSRVANFLLERSHSTERLTLTHQEIADELGSSREVISRILGSIAKHDLIQLGRGTITILEREKLKSFSLR